MLLLKCFLALLSIAENMFLVPALSATDFDLHRLNSEGFEFIYHSEHRLLLTIHDEKCYYTFMEADLHDNLIVDSFLDRLQARVKAVILDEEHDHGQKQQETLEDMRDMFQDLLADFHCLNYDIFLLHIDYLDCTFEDVHARYCAWKQTTDGNHMQWRLHTGETPTVLTGPSADHTLQSGQGSYLYLEANAGVPGQQAEMVSPVLNAVEGLCIRFWYNMYGADIGNLTVIAQEDLQPNNSLRLWSMSGNQGQGWKVAEVSVPGHIIWTYNMRVYIQGTLGNGYYGDIAIDDIGSTTGICVPDKLSCNFEKDLCEWTQGELADLEWVRYTGRVVNGPNSADHSAHRNNNYYVLMNATSGHPNDLAVLQSPLVSLKEPMCLTFYYQMGGHATGELDVVLRKVQDRLHYSDVTILDRVGAGNAGWHKANVTVSVPSAHDLVQIRFQATRGPSSSTNIAIDTVVGLVGSCDQYANTPATGLLDG